MNGPVNLLVMRLRSGQIDHVIASVRGIVTVQRSRLRLRTVSVNGLTPDVGCAPRRGRVSFGLVRRGLPQARCRVR